MATAPQPQLPLFYKDLLPLNSRDHADWKVTSFQDAGFLANTHAIPLTVDEFVDAQRDYPIVFTAGDNPLPIALMGLNEGVNTFIDDNGKLEAGVYVPAYIRRYPFGVAAETGGERMMVVVDRSYGGFTSGAGEKLFDGAAPTTFTNNAIDFTKRYEEDRVLTRRAMEALKSLDIIEVRHGSGLFVGSFSVDALLDNLP